MCFVSGSLRPVVRRRSPPPDVFRARDSPRPRTLPRPPLFDWLEREGRVEREEMFRTFNCGIGYTLIVPKDSREAIIGWLANAGLDAWTIGEIVPARGDRVEIA